MWESIFPWDHLVVDNALYYQITSSVYPMFDFPVKGFHHAFVTHLTMTNNRKLFFVDQIYLVQSSLSPFVFI